MVWVIWLSLRRTRDRHGQFNAKTFESADPFRIESDGRFECELNLEASQVPTIIVIMFLMLSLLLLLLLLLLQVVIVAVTVVVEVFQINAKTSASMKIWLQSSKDKKVFALNWPCLSLVRRKLSQMTQTYNTLTLCRHYFSSLKPSTQLWSDYDETKINSFLSYSYLSLISVVQMAKTKTFPRCCRNVS